MFFERLQSLCARDGTDVSNVLRELGLSTSKGTAWKGGAIPKGDILLKLANHFRVSTDYLLGNSDDPSLPGKEKTPASQTGNGLNESTEYLQLSPENRALVDALIDQLLKGQSDG